MTPYRIQRMGMSRLPFEVHDGRRVPPVIAAFDDPEDAETFLAIKEGRAGVVLVTSTPIRKVDATPQKQSDDT